MGYLKLTSCVLAALIAAACGGESSGGGVACGDTAGCGGDVTGTWRVTAMCADIVPGAIDTSSLPPECQGSLLAAASAASYVPRNYSITLLADGTYRESGEIAFSFTWSIDSRCFTALGAPLSADSCASVSQSLASNSTPGSCTFANTACRCTFTNTIAATDSGTWRTDGSLLYTDEGTATASSGPYCVTGTSMSYSETTPDGTITVRMQR